MDAATLYVILLALTPSILGQCTRTTAAQFFKRSVYEFSIDLTQRIAVDTDNHFIASTLSPWTLLATLSLVAGEDTYTDLKQVLRLHTQSCFNDQMFDIIKDVEAVGEGTRLERSTSIFIDADLTVKDTFYSQMARAGIIDHIDALDFKDSYVVAEKINEYFRSATRGLINEIVSSDELDEGKLLLIDAIFFKGTWASKFDVQRTEVSDFYGSDGLTKVGDVNMMFAAIPTKLARVELLEANVLELPYDNDKFSMLVFLPDPTRTVSDVIADMKLVSLNAVFHILNKREPEVVNIHLPRFNMTSDLDNLKELLSDMNLRSVFSTDASFPGISDESLYVSNFIQKASIVVNEYGTEVSEVTEVLLSFRNLPADFYANRPFLFMIVDRKRQMPIFTGAYSQPSLE